MTPEIRIGDAFYVKEADSYTYRKTRKPEDRYREVYVLGETSRSWLVAAFKSAHPKLCAKVPKADPFGLKGRHSPRLFTAQMVQEDIWSDNNRHRIATRVSHAPYAELRKIAEIIGYHEDRRSE